MTVPLDPVHDGDASEVQAMHAGGRMSGGWAGLTTRSTGLHSGSMEPRGIIPVQRGLNQVAGVIRRPGYAARARHNSLGHKR